ncbi:hypothetical protein DER29_0457 [Micromonospora sp. M71_S20]|uniref:hypothetical protein n=1 Tax=Micromonospora sp. M71_S20 TaxID=592872 RepID=UPI000EAF1DAA|nr:hypothetical protein [Micromonospora sp. M71_S20]RLK22620.1 hypothetical protein DER29_0457 [Micromonospora sp. M71_S20]
MLPLFSYTDKDGDLIEVERETAEGPDVPLAVTVAPVGEGRAVAYLSREAVDRLRAALAPFGTRREAPPETGNPAAILDYVDPDGDALTVYTRTNPAEPLSMSINAGEDHEQNVHLTAEGVTRLRAALAPHDPAERPTTGTAIHSLAERFTRATPTPAVEVGREYRLLPDARYTNGERAIFDADVTRVQVVDGPTRQGNVRVRCLDGEYDRGAEFHVGPTYLAPLTGDATPTATVVDELTPADVADLVDPCAYVVTDDSFPLDARRVAALKLAHELYPDAAPGDLMVIVAFLVGGMGGVAELAASAATAATVGGAR